MSTKPKRIVQRRTRGWRKPEGAVSVARPSKWGNPYLIIPCRDGLGDPAAKVIIPEGGAVKFFTHDPYLPDETSAIAQARGFAVGLFRDRWMPLHVDAARAELRGKDLMCFCPLDQPCHADVLLEIANA